MRNLSRDEARPQHEAIKLPPYLIMSKWHVFRGDSYCASATPEHASGRVDFPALIPETGGSPPPHAFPAFPLSIVPFPASNTSYLSHALPFPTQCMEASSTPTKFMLDLPPIS